ncbi:Bcr/CflA family multidrug efflux MFS transporter [Cellvibrio sp. pealriver]|uniref:Bcr/CflA family multidrug efflux MFS transporter n=1 Tax=Cellvibrio sp. pealriver TaxID=1622269 RepID=UPI00066FF387|nr:Bcr/CflA family multidrug efflux MFS transporter [Cellvibrio sp. pealriver]
MTKETHPFLIVLLAAVIATTPLAVDMYLPAMPDIARDLDAHIGSVQQSLSIFLAAYGVGMLLFGPLADSLGRRPLAIFGLTGFTLCSIALAFVDNIHHFLLLRALQAFCGAAATVVVPGLVRHLYQEHTAKGMSYLSMIMMLAPLLAPSIGSAILWVSEWHSIFIVLALYGALIFAFVWKWLPEISQPINDSPKVTGNFFSGYKVVFSNSQARPLIASMMFGSFAFFCFITAVSFVYIDYFGVSEQMFSVLFGVNVICLIIANFINSRVVTRFGSLHMLRIGIALALVSALLLCGFNFFGLNIWFSVFSIAPLMAGLTLASTNTDALVLMKFPHNSGTATAVMGTLRFGSGAFAGPLLAFFYTGTAMPFSLLMLAGVLGVIICQVWFFYTSRYEKK